MTIKHHGPEVDDAMDLHRTVATALLKTERRYAKESIKNEIKKGRSGRAEEGKRTSFRKIRADKGTRGQRKTYPAFCTNN